MRFGIMAMQVGYLIPPGLTAGQALAHTAGFKHAELVAGLVDKGFNLIELGGDLGMFLPQVFEAQAIRRLVELKSQRGLDYTVHLPLWSVEPSTPLVPVRLGSVQALVESIQATRLLEPEMYVMHATGPLAAEFYRMNLPEVGHNLLLRQFQDGARRSLRSILAQTGISSRQLAIETIEFPLDLTLEMAEELDLSICFDAGHVLAGFPGPADFFSALERCLPRLGEVHLHDSPWRGPGKAPAYGLDHQALGKGDLDVKRFLNRLAQAGFNGPIIFELSVAETLASLGLIRSLGISV